MVVSSFTSLDARTIAIAEEFINCSCFAFNKTSNKRTASLTNTNTEHTTAVPPQHSNSFGDNSCVSSVWLHSVPRQWVDPAARGCFCQDDIRIIFRGCSSLIRFTLELNNLSELHGLSDKGVDWPDRWSQKRVFTCGRACLGHHDVQQQTYCQHWARSNCFFPKSSLPEMFWLFFQSFVLDEDISNLYFDAECWQLYTRDYNFFLLF